MFKRILAAVDGSMPSLHALQMASELAIQQKAELHILGVVPPLPAIALEGFSPEYLPTYHDDLEEATQKTLKNAEDETHRSYPELKVATHIKEGRVAKMITETAAEIGADLIVVGSRGTSGVLTWILGSVTREVADSCTVPVLIAKDPAYCT
ncbi:universal stress protein [Candidatus Bathyarchaeota archaeon]|nr:universal stress protein [Candidatus Bathyarchaeota archaeon]